MNECKDIDNKDYNGRSKTDRPADCDADTEGGQLIRNREAYSDRLLIIGSLAIGVLFTALFYGQYPGISVPVFVTAFYTLLLTYTAPVLKRNNSFAWFLSIPVVLLSLTYFLFGNYIFFLLNLLALPALILLQTLLITGTNSFRWFSPGILVDLFYGIFYRCFVHIGKPFVIMGACFHRNKKEGGNKSIGYRILIGLLISLPLLFILLALLSSADMVFGSLVERLPRLLDGLNLGDGVGRTLVTVAIGLTVFSYLWSLGHGDRPADAVLKSSPSPLPRNCWDQVIVITVTAAVDILYAIFVTIQFTYLFGGAGLPDGLTYSEYARRGFLELVLVTLLNIGLLGITLTYTKTHDAHAAGLNQVDNCSIPKASLAAEECLTAEKASSDAGNSEAHAKDTSKSVTSAAGLIFRLVNTIMISCTFIMLASAFYRMSLYEQAYGYTFLRITTQAFMVLLLCLFAITLAKVWNHRLPLVKPYLIAAVVAFTVANYINVDQIIAQKNIERYYETKVIDISYFRSLSSDAAVKLKALAADKNTKVAAEAREVLKQRRKQLSEKNCWQSFNLSDYLAGKALEK